MKYLGTIFIIILLLGLGFSLYALYLNWPTEPVDFGQFLGKTPQSQNYTSSRQFYPNMRFPDTTITYTIEPTCDTKKTAEVTEAIKILENDTMLSFYPSNSGEISIVCSELAPEPEQKGHFVAGEGGPTEIINNSIYSVILAGKISLYRDETCGTPQIALHEMLHVLGFDHNNNPNSILYPTTSCKQKFDDYIINDINNLYSIKSAADLAIDKVSAYKTGRYLNFNITIDNYGLKNSLNVTLSVSSEGEKIQDFTIGVIEIGTKKTLNVQNLLIQRDSKMISFILDPTNKIDEISKSNNQAELVI